MVMLNKPHIRVLLTKSALDGHDRGVRVIAKTLRDEGMEVIYSNYELPEDIVAVAVQEDVDIIGISYLSGGQVGVTKAVKEILSVQGLDDLPVIVGGAIRPFDVPKLEALNISGIFRGGDRLQSIVDHIKQAVGQQ